MPSITWKPIKDKFYPYLDRCSYSPTKKGPHCQSIYLGSTIQRAEGRLQELVQDPEELSRLLDDLYRKYPQGKPQQGDREKLLKALGKLVAQVKDEYAHSVLLEAMVRLTGKKVKKK